MFDSHTNTVAGGSVASVDPAQQFQYKDKLLEVVIIENGEDDRDGYVELTAAAQLLAPLVSIRGFNPAVLWANVHNSQRLTRNNKNYVHAFALGRYLSAYNMSSNGGGHRPELLVLKQLICDLLMGAQSHVVDPLQDIKTQLCTLQECLTGGQSSGVASNIYQPNNNSYDIMNNNTETLREILRSEHAILLANISGALETIKSIQSDLTNKLAFGNDTMLDGFKSIKDAISRKK